MSNYILDKGYVADGDIAANRIVIASTGGKVKQSDTLNAEGIKGVSVESAKDGETVTVSKIGIAELKAGGTVGDGDPVGSDATGRGIKADITEDTHLVKNVVGFAEASAVVDDIFSVLVIVGILSATGLVAKPYTAVGDIAVNKIVIATTADAVKQEDAANAPLIMGISLNAVADGETVIVMRNGPAKIKITENINMGEFIGGDSSADAVKISPVLGANIKYAAAIAQASGVTNDVIDVLVAIQVIPVT